jgi:hypothetical protein
VAQLYPRALGSLYAASYDSQGSGGGILTRLHTGVAFGVGVLIAADRQSTSSTGYRASLWDPRPDFILFFFFRLTII